MLLEKDVVGKKIDWGNYITLSDEHDTPVMKRIKAGPKPVAVTKRYQADTYREPSNKTWPDGKDWDAFRKAGAQRKELQSRVQFNVNTAAVSKLAEDVTTVAGLNDELGREIVKEMKMVGRDFECAFASDQGSVQDQGDGVVGHSSRGIGKWVQAGAQSDADDDVDASLRPAAVQIYSDTKANFFETALLAVLQGCWQKTGRTDNIWMPVGSSLKSQINLFQFYVPGSLSTQSTARVMQRKPGETLTMTLDMYDCEFGKVEIELSKWNQYYGGDADSAFGGATAATQGQWRGYVLHPDMWSLNWNQKPTVFKPEYKGGSYKAAIETILMLQCLNPVGEGKIAPSDA